MGGSGLDKIIETCGLSILGMGSLALVKYIKRARYCIQVVACVMLSLLTPTHEESGDKDLMLKCVENQTEGSELCHYWYIIIDLMLNLLLF